MSRAWRILARVVAFCAGLAPFLSCGAYGVPSYEPKFTAFSYSPDSPVRFGDTLIFQAQVNDPRITFIRVRIDGLMHHWTDLNDAGLAPDVTAGDGVWTGALYWKAKMGAEQDLRVSADAYYAPAQSKIGEVQGSPLTVLP
jgi:hypothetical protein